MLYCGTPGNLCGVSRETNGGYGYRSSFGFTPAGGFELATPSQKKRTVPLSRTKTAQI